MIVYVCVFADKVRRLSSIHEAVRFGDVTELQAMVQNGAGINDVDPKFKFTPLHWACNYGSLEVLRTLKILSLAFFYKKPNHLSNQNQNSRKVCGGMHVKKLYI
jgi:ankyrin repeat protein